MIYFGIELSEDDNGKEIIKAAGITFAMNDDQAKEKLMREFKASNTSIFRVVSEKDIPPEGQVWIAGD